MASNLIAMAVKAGCSDTKTKQQMLTFSMCIGHVSFCLLGKDSGGLLLLWSSLSWLLCDRRAFGQSLELTMKGDEDTGN